MRVVVLGAGISGLWCALALREAGHEVQVVTADDLAGTTSYVAAAVWYPTAVGPAEAVARWGRETFAKLAADAGRTPGVSMLRSVSLHRRDPGRPAWLDAVAGLTEVEPVPVDPPWTHGLRCTVPLVEMPVYLPHLLEQVRRAGVSVARRRVAALDELLGLHPDVVVNAAGLAGGPLAGDGTVTPIRGQVVRVANPGLTTSVRDEEHPEGRVYVHPRSADCVLGGTLETGVWDLEPDPGTTRAILRRCREVVPALADAEVLGTAVGLRPGRPEVRLEVDRGLLPVPVVHDYGHGGAGVTVGWGCALEVAGLVSGLVQRAGDRSV